MLFRIIYKKSQIFGQYIGLRNLILNIFDGKSLHSIYIWFTKSGTKGSTFVMMRLNKNY